MKIVVKEKDLFCLTNSLIDKSGKIDIIKKIVDRKSSWARDEKNLLPFYHNFSFF
jgi:hypothetical protein